MEVGSPSAIRHSPRRLSPRENILPSSPHRQPALTNDDAEMIDLAPNVLSKAYTILASQSRVALRNIGRKWHLGVLEIRKNSFTVTYYICYIVRELKNIFVSQNLRSVGDPEDVITQSVPEASGTGSIGVGGTAPGFSISEFARLYVMLRADHMCRAALVKLTRDIKRADFEAGRTRESFWKDIEIRFNNDSLQYPQSFEGSVPEADSAAPPLCFRRFETLKTQVRNARKAFKIVYSNYTQYGQNDPEKWPAFLATDRSEDFVAVRKKCYIIFIVCRLHTEAGQDMFLLNATTKTIEGGDDEGSGEGTASGSSGSKRKRMIADEYATKMDKRCEGLHESMRESHIQGNQIQESIRSKQQTLVTGFADVAERDSVLEMVQNTYNPYTDAKQKGADEKLLGFLKDNYETCFAAALNRYSTAMERDANR